MRTLTLSGLVALNAGLAILSLSLPTRSAYADETLTGCCKTSTEGDKVCCIGCCLVVRECSGPAVCQPDSDNAPTEG